MWVYRPLVCLDLHAQDMCTELLHFLPVGEFNVGLGIGFAFVDFHHQFHQIAIDQMVFVVGQFACEDANMLGLPCALFKKFARVSVGFWGGFVRFVGQNADAEKSAGDVI